MKKGVTSAHELDADRIHVPGQTLREIEDH